MNVQAHEELKSKIWEIANRLRGPYRPPQYRLVMLPMVVLRRLDCVLEPSSRPLNNGCEGRLAITSRVGGQSRLAWMARDGRSGRP